MIYSCSLDKVAKGVTIGVAILFTLIIASQFLLLNDKSILAPIAISTLLIAVFISIYAFSPVQYVLTPEALIIHRPFSDVHISKETLTSVQIVDKETMKWTIRTFGVGGLFGYYGKFANRKLGSMTFYATRRTNFVLLITSDGRKIILTPDEPQSFMEHFNKLYVKETII